MLLMSHMEEDPHTLQYRHELAYGESTPIPSSPLSLYSAAHTPTLTSRIQPESQFSVGTFCCWSLEKAAYRSSSPASTSNDHSLLKKKSAVAERQPKNSMLAA